MPSIPKRVEDRLIAGRVAPTCGPVYSQPMPLSAATVLSEHKGLTR